MMASEWGEGTERDGFVVPAPEGASWEVGCHWNMGYLKQVTEGFAINNMV